MRGTSLFDESMQPDKISRLSILWSRFKIHSLHEFTSLLLDVWCNHWLADLSEIAMILASVPPSVNIHKLFNNIVISKAPLFSIFCHEDQDGVELCSDKFWCQNIFCCHGHDYLNIKEQSILPRYLNMNIQQSRKITK